MTDIPQIAKSLSEAQRRAIAAFVPIPGYGLWCPTYRDMGRMVSSLRELGLVKKRSSKATKLGLAVKEYLERNET